MEYIRALREKAGLNQADLAKIIGVDRTAVIKWELADVFPRADKLPQLADALHCTIDALFGRGQPSA